MENKEETFKVFSGIGAVLSIIADLVTVGLLFKNLYCGVIPFNIQSTLPWLLIIIIIFLFSILLYNMADTGSEILDGIIIIFSWFYVILATLMFSVVSKKFIIDANYEIYDYLGYIFLIVLISGLGFIISDIVAYSRRNFSLPFILVGLYQVLLWLSLCFRPQLLVFNLHSLGNALLLAIVGALIVYCRRE